jgi:hypothetical protein
VLGRIDAVTRDDAEGAAKDVFGRPMALAVIGPFTAEEFAPSGTSPVVPPSPVELGAAAHEAGGESPR